MRDSRKDGQYFKDFLKIRWEILNETIADTESLNYDEGDYRYGVCYSDIFREYFDILKGSYSAGHELDKIKEIYFKMIPIMQKHWDTEPRYYETISMLSIGIMLNAPKEVMFELKKIIERDGVQDYLIDFLLGAIDEEWKQNYNKFFIKIPYQSLSKVINAQTKEEAVKNLKIYLTKYWYKGHSDAGWYDTHTYDDIIYSGYWSYESGAIAKILQLDDSSLKDAPYYPYDMVHYQD